MNASDTNFINQFIRGFERGFNVTYNDLLNSNVIVRPTEQQIQNASRLVRYGDISEPISECCPITLERFRLDDNVRQIETCGHIFLPQAFNQWFNSNVRCPVCRFDIREHTNNSSINTIQENVHNDENDDENENENENENDDVENNSNQENINNSNVNSGQYDNVIAEISSRLIHSLIGNNSENNDNRFMFDASNNILFYETILRANNSSNTNNNNISN